MGECKYCCGDIVLYQRTRDTTIEINTKGKARALYTSVEVNGLSYRAAFIINFCPHCGRQLGDIEELEQDDESTKG